MVYMFCGITLVKPTQFRLFKVFLKAGKTVYKIYLKDFPQKTITTYIQDYSLKQYRQLAKKN